MMFQQDRSCWNPPMMPLSRSLKVRSEKQRRKLVDPPPVDLDDDQDDSEVS